MMADLNDGQRSRTLTFDDGPHPTLTPQVFDVLDRHRVKATFFLMGRNVERYPDVAREVVGRGHEVGNHSYSHPKLLMMSPARVREEIARTDDLIRGLGVSAPIHFRPAPAAKFIVLPYVLTRMQKLSVLSVPNGVGIGAAQGREMSIGRRGFQASAGVPQSTRQVAGVAGSVDPRVREPLCNH